MDNLPVAVLVNQADEHYRVGRISSHDIEGLASVMDQMGPGELTGYVLCLVGPGMLKKKADLDMAGIAEVGAVINGYDDLPAFKDRVRALLEAAKPVPMTRKELVNWATAYSKARPKDNEGRVRTTAMALGELALGYQLSNYQDWDTGELIDTLGGYLWDGLVGYSKMSFNKVLAELLEPLGDEDEDIVVRYRSVMADLFDPTEDK